MNAKVILQLSFEDRGWGIELWAADHIPSFLETCSVSWLE